MGLTFEWKPRKATLRLKKHGVAFEEAATTFADSLSLAITDPDHPVGEGRFLLLGHSYRLRLLVVAHAETGERIRIIRARLASALERKTYEEE
jgi:uncharacterized protein